VKMSISKQKMFNCEEVFGPYNRSELPFSYVDGTSIRNSESDFNCWFIENPLNKELQKTLSYTMEPNSTHEFIVVIKAPKNKLQSRVMSFINVELAAELGTETEKHVNHLEERVVLKE